jgi:hypothetical protein
MVAEREPPTATQDVPEEIKERIRKLAYFMWEAGGCQHGRALEYWLEAERRILATLKAEAAQAKGETARPATAPAATRQEPPTATNDKEKGERV